MVDGHQYTILDLYVVLGPNWELWLLKQPGQCAPEHSEGKCNAQQHMLDKSSQIHTQADICNDYDYYYYIFRSFHFIDHS